MCDAQAYDRREHDYPSQQATYIRTQELCSKGQQFCRQDWRTRRFSHEFAIGSSHDGVHRHV